MWVRGLVLLVFVPVCYDALDYFYEYDEETHDDDNTDFYDSEDDDNGSLTISIVTITATDHTRVRRYGTPDRQTLNPQETKNIEVSLHDIRHITWAAEDISKSSIPHYEYFDKSTVQSSGPVNRTSSTETSLESSIISGSLEASSVLESEQSSSTQALKTQEYDPNMHYRQVLGLRKFNTIKHTAQVSSTEETVSQDTSTLVYSTMEHATQWNATQWSVTEDTSIDKNTTQGSVTEETAIGMNATQGTVNEEAKIERNGTHAMRYFNDPSTTAWNLLRKRTTKTRPRTYWANKTWHTYPKRIFINGTWHKLPSNWPYDTTHKCVAELMDTTTTVRPTLKMDMEGLMDLIANLTYDYDMNLVQRFNQTLIKYSVPTCPRSTTPPSTTPMEFNFANTSVVGKCFVCGLEEEEIPRNAHCADAFAGDFLPLVPVDNRAKGQIARYRKYCRFLDVSTYMINEDEPRAVYGRFTGGCSVRWTDLTGVYTQRTCRNKRKAVMGKHFASQRMAKLEMALHDLDNGCIASPMASLLPLSRGISLYARFHACVCTGAWCNSGVRNTPWILNLLVSLWFHKYR